MSIASLNDADDLDNFLHASGAMEEFEHDEGATGFDDADPWDVGAGVGAPTPDSQLRPPPPLLAGTSPAHTRTTAPQTGVMRRMLSERGMRERARAQDNSVTRDQFVTARALLADGVASRGSRWPQVSPGGTVSGGGFDPLTVAAFWQRAPARALPNCARQRGYFEE